MVRSAICLAVLLGFCVITWSLRAEMAGENAGVKSSTPLSAKLQSILEQRERTGWEAFKNKDQKAFADVITDDYTAVLADGQGEHDRQSTFDSMSQITIHHYSLSDFKLSPLGVNAALLRYKASSNYSIGEGQGQDYKLAVGDIWVKRGEQWKSLRYQETEVK